MEEISKTRVGLNVSYVLFAVGQLCGAIDKYFQDSGIDMPDDIQNLIAGIFMEVYESRREVKHTCQRSSPTPTSEPTKSSGLKE